MLAEPSADGDSKDDGNRANLLVDENFQAILRARMASQSPGALGPFLLPNRRSVQPNFIFPVAGSNLSGRTIDQRLYFLNTRTVRSWLLKEGLQVFHLGGASDIDTERGENPQGGVRPLLIHGGGEDGGRLVDVREQEHHEERHEPHGQGKQDDLPSILAQDGEIFPQIDHVFLVSRGGVFFRHLFSAPELRVVVSHGVYRYCYAAESSMDLMLPSLPDTPPASEYRS